MMKRGKRELSVLIILVAVLSGLQAQQTVASGGGNGSGTGGSVSYTVGQLVYTTSSGTGGSVVQGVQQPYEISVLTSVKDAESITLNLSVYPNPTRDYLILKIKGLSDINFVATLYDMNGMMVQTLKVDSEETTFPMQEFLSSVYILRVTQGNREVKSFKIIKH